MPPKLVVAPETIKSADGTISLADFYAVPAAGHYIFMPTREPWPASSIDVMLPPILLPHKVNGKQATMLPSRWLRRFRHVEQLSWLPGGPEIIRDRVIAEGGWRERPGTACLNLYHPPLPVLGDASQATPWCEHLRRIYPEDADHIVKWLAHRVQQPGEKPNHALVMGGKQGIGKDMLLAPVRTAVGTWNFQDISPINLLEPFNPFVKAVVLRMNEAHDLGESDRANRYALYERVKIYAAAPPEILRCNEKHLRQYYVPNVLGLIISTNHKTGGVYLPSDDRRHFIAWSPCEKEEFTAEYFNQVWAWLLYEGGNAHVAAYLAQHDLSAFDAHTLPPQTPAFWEIVAAGQAPEDQDLADLIDELKHPDTCSLISLLTAPSGAGFEWLLDRRQRRSIPHRMERCGYVACRNPDSKDGRWSISGRWQTLYVKERLNHEQRLRACRDFVLQQTKTGGSN
jgi:Family of unknown function (DUF5906)